MTSTPMTARLLRAWRTLLRQAAQARRNRRDLEILSQLDDRQLSDIGLARGDIPHVLAARAPGDLETRHRPSPHALRPTSVCRSAT